MGRLHRFVLGRFAEGAVGAALAEHFGAAALPPNAALDALPMALAKAHEAQGGTKVLFVVNEDNRNFADWCQAAHVYIDLFR